MKIRDIIDREQETLSMEVFPPKKDTDFEMVKEAALHIASLKPSFMSVTYGAGGSTKGNTIKLASEIQKQYQVPAMAHLTCVCATKESINTCYPEVHPDSKIKFDDFNGLKEKVKEGCEFLTTQMFFDNNIFFNFMYRVREAGIHIPIIPGIMPITKRAQVKNAVKLSGCNVPERFKNIIDKYGDTENAMKQAGVIYASDQIIDLLANGVKNIHIYSMNKPEIAKGIQDNLK